MGRSCDQNGGGTTTVAKLTRLREEGFEKVGEDKKRNAFCLRRIIGIVKDDSQCSVTLQKFDLVLEQGNKKQEPH